MKSFLFPDNDFGTLSFLFGQYACVTHLLRGQPIVWNAIIEIV